MHWNSCNQLDIKITFNFYSVRHSPINVVNVCMVNWNSTVYKVYKEQDKSDENKSKCLPACSMFPHPCSYIWVTIRSKLCCWTMSSRVHNYIITICTSSRCPWDKFSIWDLYSRWTWQILPQKKTWYVKIQSNDR